MKLASSVNLAILAVLAILVPLVTCQAHVAGIQGSITAAGLQRIVDVALPLAIARIRETPLEGDSGVSDGYKYSISDVRLRDLSISRGVASINNGISLSVQGLHVNIKLHWSYKKKKFPYLPRGSGSADVTFDSSEIGATVQILNSGGRPQVRCTGAVVHVNNVKIKVHGSIFSWLYNLMIKLFSSKIKAGVQNAIQANFAQAINAVSDQIIATMPLTSPISRWGVLTNAITDNAQYYGAQVMVPFNAEVYPASTGASTGKVPRPNMAFVPGGRMFELNFNMFVLNSAANSYIAMGGLSRTTTQANKPANFPDMNTSAWGTLIPQLASKYPNQPFKYTTSSNGPLVFAAQNGAVSVSGSFLITGFVGESTQAFQIAANLQGALALSVETRPQAYFVTQINNIKLNFNQVSSTVELNLGLINFVLDVLSNLAIADVNRDLLNGFPLPSIANLRVSNPAFVVQNDFIRIGLDLAYA